jgi:hypothetical protein
MTEYDIVLDGSNLLLYGMTERNKSTFKADVNGFLKKLEYFPKLGYRALLCVDQTTYNKIEKGTIQIDGSFDHFKEMLDKHSTVYIWSDHEMAEYALQYSCPIVTNDQFIDWQTGKKSNKRSKVSIEEWAVIASQRIGHKIDKNGKFSVKPPLASKGPTFEPKSRTDQLARENLRLKEKLEALNRRQQLQLATIESLRKRVSVG